MELQRFGHAPAITCTPETPISEVAVLMDTHDVGSVVVVDEDGRLSGIVTDRDLVVRDDGRRSRPEHSGFDGNDVVTCCRCGRTRRCSRLRPKWQPPDVVVCRSWTNRPG